VHREDAYVLEALHAGVHGYVIKTQAAGDLRQAIRDVLRGRIYLSPSISRAVVEAYLNKTFPRDNSLSSRERQVLQLIAEGKTSKDVAGLLSVSVRTAESHRARIMKKLNIRTTSGLVRHAIRCGLIQP
jgi:two-component system response regulator NreC